MSNIVKFLLADIIGGIPTPIETIAAVDESVGSTLGEGLVHDTSGNLYQIAPAFASSAIRRLAETPLSIDLSISPGAAPDNFLNPTFATIVSFGAPAPSAPSIFGNIIW